ncbi:RluA family pseudouridine synthase [Desulfococcus sp.]|uniref:RluA family pseudouridine synthase n=1 Tax=Desulfococcus sp. TaxID=2025834 RepID=UPI00359493D9
MMLTRRLYVSIPRHAAGVGPVDFLAGRFSYLDRASWMAEIDGGRVLVNGQRASAGLVLRGGETVAYLPADAPEPPVDGLYAVLFEDEALLAVNKPGNLPCHPGGRYFRHTLWAMLQDRSPGQGLFFVHRLDRETSGVILIAKHSRDASDLGRQMARGEFRKRYAALVEGRFPSEPVTAEGLISTDPASVIRKKMRFFPTGSLESPPDKGKPCCTQFSTLRTGHSLSLVSAMPITGRRHQIRATLLALGYPVVGDKIYGVEEALFVRFIEDRLTDPDRARLRMERQALHAAALEFHHPRTGRPLCIEAPVPEAFRRLVELAGYV